MKQITIPPPNLEPGDDLEIILYTLWGEARNQPDAGIAAVAWTIINRCYGDPGRFGASLAEVCQKTWQYSCWNAGDPNRQMIDRARAGEEKIDLMRFATILGEVFMGKIPDPTGGATHYLNPAAVASEKARRRSGMLAGREHVVIGDHHFYRPQDLTPPEKTLEKIVIRPYYTPPEDPNVTGGPTVTGATKPAPEIKRPLPEPAPSDVMAAARRAAAVVGQGAQSVAETFGDTLFGFEIALAGMRKGLRAQRAGWNGENQWIVIMPPLWLPPYNTQDESRKVNDRTAKFIGKDTPLDCQPYFAMWTSNQKWQPGWLASQADLLTSDWRFVTE